MSIDSLEAALHDAAADLPPDGDGVYDGVVREAGRRRVRRRLAFAAPVVVVALALVVAVLALPGSGHHLVVEGKTPAAPAPWHPPARRQGSHLIVTLRFLSGGSVELVLPKSVDPATINHVQPFGAVYWAGQPSLARDVTVVRGSVVDVYRGHQLLRTYRDASNHPVQLYRGVDGVNELVFQFGHWVVSVWDYPAGDARGASMTDAQRNLWATHLRGHETADGFLVLHPAAPLTPVRGSDGPAVSLQFGTNYVGLLLRACQPNEKAGRPDRRGFITHSFPDSGSWVCDPKVPLVVTVSGTAAWQRNIAANFELRDLTGPLPGDGAP